MSEVGAESIEQGPVEAYAPVLREPAHRVSPQAVPFWRVTALLGDTVIVGAAAAAYVVIPDVPGWTILLVLLVAGVTSYVVLSGDEPASKPTTTSEKPEKSEAPAEPTAQGIEEFIDDYVAAVSSDPSKSWQMLTPKFQEESGGFDNILLPSGYQLGIDTTAFAAAIAPMLRRMRLLMAVRIVSPGCVCTSAGSPAPLLRSTSPTVVSPSAPRNP